MRRLRWAGIYGLSLLVVVVVRLGLWVTTYQRLRRLLVRPCPPDPQPERIRTVARLTRAVNRMARLVPDGSCLTQTISCQALLSWKGIPSTISIGVRKEGGSELKAHAWLLWNGAVVLQGNEESVRAFSKILDLPTPTLPAGAAS